MDTCNPLNTYVLYTPVTGHDECNKSSQRLDMPRFPSDNGPMILLAIISADNGRPSSASSEPIIKPVSAPVQNHASMTYEPCISRMFIFFCHRLFLLSPFLFSFSVHFSYPLTLISTYREQKKKKKGKIEKKTEHELETTKHLYTLRHRFVFVKGSRNRW